MRRWGLAYVGRSTFPKDVSEFELEQAFRFNSKERRDISKAFRSRHRLAAALQLGFLRLTGTALASVGYVPKAVLHLIARQFRVPAPDLATIRALYRRRSTRFEHRSWAVDYFGVMRLDSLGEQGLEAALRERTHATLSRPRLELFAREWLYGRCYLIPGHRRITILVRRVARSVEGSDHAGLCRYVSAADIERVLGRLLAPRSGHVMTALEWLRRPPRRRSLRTLRELYIKYAWLEHQVGHINLNRIPRERQRVYARRFRRRRTADLAKLRPERRNLEAVCFCMVTLATLADDLLRLIELRITAIWRWAHAVATEQVTPQRINRRRELLTEIRRMASDSSVSDSAFRLQVLGLLDPSGSQIPASRAADVREVLSRNARRVRPLIELLLKLDLQRDDDHPAWSCLDWLRETYRERLDHLSPEPPVEWLGRWESLVRGDDGRRGLRAFEAATLWSVRRALRNRSLWSRFGDEYSQPIRNLMPVDVWKGQSQGYRFRKNLPPTAEAYTDFVQATLRAALTGLQEAVAHEMVTIGWKDLYFPRDDAEQIPKRGSRTFHVKTVVLNAAARHASRQAPEMTTIARSLLGDGFPAARVFANH